MRTTPETTLARMAEIAARKHLEHAERRFDRAKLDKHAFPTSELAQKYERLAFEGWICAIEGYTKACRNLDVAMGVWREPTRELELHLCIGM